ncbi:hypothetical protein Mag101_08390 [Microbulbifer agarilyticus]|uniref:Uncharacterized protein n=1 Tax=Microbulbifer agarilyticus TaxID=260552 RepID=A0A1Q2M4J9_9GAMM|nr:hypothetical protein [Microbulbifer agarilyticus]AQQ67653.1 hypothetical protein Mag101_08390 [Microbulbifer agarilyticus]
MKYIVILGLIIFCSPALATKCWTQSQNELVANSVGKDAFEFAIERAQFIFVGKAKNVQKTIYEQEGAEPRVLAVEAEFEVEEAIKGNVSGELVTKSDDICACKYQFEPGITYLVVAGKYKNKLQVYSCEYISPVDQSRVADARRIIDVNKARQ